MSTVIHNRVEQCRQGIYEQLIGRVSSGWVVAGDAQFLQGYCLIYPDPVVPHMNVLTGEQRKILMYEASIVGDALLSITDAVRINYEVLGNLAPALHVHIFPRYASESNDLKTKPVWFYDWDNAQHFELEKDKLWMTKVRDYLHFEGLLVT